MNRQQLKSLIKKVLQQDERLWNEEKSELNQTQLFDLLEKIDEKVISLLIQEKGLKKKFFVKIQDAYVFKTNDFRFFMEENKIDNSYTQYKNRIGLTDGKRFLNDTNDVVLDWPYKDCVLEGGQSTEEGEDTYFKKDKDGHYEPKRAKRKEIFFNEILAQDEIDRLFDPKALVNWKRYTKAGEQKVGKIKRDADGTIRENLIIKGNNLLALHSLKSQFTGKVKVIYIDPPYNTGNDGFKYNDNFNHSTWLTFMKNRLAVARELLRDDGAIFVQCDDNEQAYLKVLMDEIFGKKCFIGCIAYRKTDNQANIGSFARVKEYILFYSKNEKIILNKVPLTEKAKKEYRYSDEIGKFRRAILLHKTRGSHNYNIKTLTGKILDGPWMINKEKFSELEKVNGIYWTRSGDEQPYGKIYLKDSKGQIPNDWIDKEYGTNQQAAVQLEKLLGYRAFNFSKAVPLVQYLIGLASTDGHDIILDYHPGSGTTAHAVCELNKEDEGNRKYIMIEQMDYINTVTCPRVSKVMEKENASDSFIYLELAKWNAHAKETILACKSFSELESFFEEMVEKCFLAYNLKIKKFKETVIKEKEFRKLPLAKKKAMFIAMLDNNQMYVNKTEIIDKDFRISKADQKLTKEFYDG